MFADETGTNSCEAGWLSWSASVTGCRLATCSCADWPGKDDVKRNEENLKLNVIHGPNNRRGSHVIPAVTGTVIKEYV